MTCSAARSADAPAPVEPDGTVNVPAFKLPPSVYLSGKAKKFLLEQPVDYSAIFTKMVEGGPSRTFV